MSKLRLDELISLADATTLGNLGIIQDYKSLVQIVNLTNIDIHNKLVINKDIIEIPLTDKTLYTISDYIKN